MWQARTQVRQQWADARRNHLSSYSYSQVFIIVCCYVEAALLLFLSWAELKNANFSLRVLLSTKFCILFLTEIFLLSKQRFTNHTTKDAAGHFLYYPDGIAITVSLISMETLRFIIFFLVCYFFTKKAASLLPNKKTWIFALKVLLIVNIAWCLLSSLGNFLAYSFAWYDYKNLCKTTVFMTLRFSGEVITGVFAAIGAIITRQIYRIPRDT